MLEKLKDMRNQGKYKEYEEMLLELFASANIPNYAIPSQDRLNRKSYNKEDAELTKEEYIRKYSKVEPSQDSIIKVSINYAEQFEEARKAIIIGDYEKLKYLIENHSYILDLHSSKTGNCLLHFVATQPNKTEEMIEKKGKSDSTILHSKFSKSDSERERVIKYY